jgi:AAA family ATP:ADP antiporter
MSDPSRSGMQTFVRWIRRVLVIEPGEALPLAVSCGLTFLIFTACFILRPIRDAIQSEQDLSSELPWVVTATLVGMFVASAIFSTIASRVPRRLILPAVLELFAFTTIVFFVLFHKSDGATLVWTSRAFYVWYSVVNLLAISTAWSVFTDTYSVDQSRRLFAKISIGSTVGAMTGSKISALFAESLGTNMLLPISVVLLQVAVVLGWWVSGRARSDETTLTERPSDTSTTSESTRPSDQRIGGGILDGVIAVATQPYLLLIAGYILLYTITSTFLSIQQSRILATIFSHDDPGAARAARTAFSADISFLSNQIVLGTQLLLSARITRWLGIRRTLFVTPVVTVLGFALIAWRESATTLLIAMVGRSSMHYAIDRPSREALYSPLSRELKYKAKNLIDTFVYRGGDALTAWWVAFLPVTVLLCATLSIQIGLHASDGLLAWWPAFVPKGVPLALSTLIAALAWCVIAYPLGRHYLRRVDERASRTSPEPGPRME